MTDQLAAAKRLHTAAAPVHVRTLRTIAEVEELRPLWMDWQTEPNADIDFFLMTCRAKPEIIRPHVLVIYRDGLPDALLVGRLEDAAADMKIGYARIMHLRTRRLAFNQGGFLGRTSPANSEILLHEVIRCLKNNDALVALFSHLRADSPLYEAARCVPGVLSRDHALRTATHRGMSVPSNIDQLYQRFSGSVRCKLKQKAKKLLRDFPGGVQVRTFTDPVDLGLMIQDVEGVACGTYQRGLGVGFADTPELRSRMALSAEKSWLRAYVLYIAERPCAFWIGALYRGVFHSNFMGYDRTFAKYSPGMFLVLKAIESFCESRGDRRVREIDWGRGDAQYKELLSDREWKDGSVSVFAPTLTGLRLNVALTVPTLVDSLAKEALGQVGLLQKVKTLWRKYLVSDRLHKENAPTQQSEQQAHGNENT